MLTDRARAKRQKCLATIFYKTSWPVESWLVAWFHMAFFKNYENLMHLTACLIFLWSKLSRQNIYQYQNVQGLLTGNVTFPLILRWNSLKSLACCITLCKKSWCFCLRRFSASNFWAFSSFSVKRASRKF